MKSILFEIEFSRFSCLIMRGDKKRGSVLTDGTVTIENDFLSRYLF